MQTRSTYLRFASLHLIFACALQVFLAGPSLAQSTVVFSEDFESGSPPAGWQRSQNSPSVGWEFGTNLGSQHAPITNHTRYAAVNDDAHDDQTTNLNLADRDRLTSPELDITPYSSGVLFLRFKYLNSGDYGMIGQVEVFTSPRVTHPPIYTVPTTPTWQTALVDLSAYTTSSTFRFTFRADDGGEWADAFAVDDVELVHVTGNDAQVDQVLLGEFAEVGARPISAQITNMGGEPVHSLRLNYQVDGGPIYSADIDGLSIAPLASVELVHPDLYSFGVPGAYPVTVWTSLVNGGPDVNPGNDAATTTHYVVTETPIKRPILEVHTGNWCQFCPDATVRMENVQSTYPNAITVAVHSNDAMAIADGNSISSEYINGYPAGTIDRFPVNGVAIERNRGNWDGDVASRIGDVVPVRVHLRDVVHNAVAESLEVTVEAEFVGPATGDMRLNVWLLENHVVGSGSGYDQVNFYNTQSGHPYAGAGNPIVGFEHNRVLRATGGGPWGTDRVIPESVNAGETYSWTYTLSTTGVSFVDSRLVGLVQRYDVEPRNRHILNAAEIPAFDQGELFADGFESGNLRAWSSAVP